MGKVQIKINSILLLLSTHYYLWIAAFLWNPKKKNRSQQKKSLHDSKYRGNTTYIMENSGCYWLHIDLLANCLQRDTNTQCRSAHVRWFNVSQCRNIAANLVNTMLYVSVFLWILLRFWLLLFEGAILLGVLIS